MNSPAAWTRGGFGVAPKAFLARRPTAPGREASCVLCDLPRREFGPFRPELSPHREEERDPNKSQRERQGQ